MTLTHALYFNDANDRFEPHPKLEKILPKSLVKLTRPNVAPNGDLWIGSLDGNFVMRKKDDGTYEADYSAFQILTSFIIDEIIFDENDVAWLLSQKTLARIDMEAAPEAKTAPAPIIQSLGKTRSKELAYHRNTFGGSGETTLPYSENNIVFKFSTPFYLSRKPIYHQHFL